MYSFLKKLVTQEYEQNKKKLKYGKINIDTVLFRFHFPKLIYLVINYQ